MREIGEETRIEGDALFTAGVVDSFYDPAANTIELMPVFVLMIPQEAPVTLDHSQSEYTWLDVSAAEVRLTFAGHRRALLTIRHDFIDRMPDPLRRIVP